VLFVHRDADVVDSCLEELKKAQFAITSDLVLTLAQHAQQLQQQTYDVMVAEYPSPSWMGSQALQLLNQPVQEVPSPFVTTPLGSESIAQLTADGAFDYIEREHLAQTRLRCVSGVSGWKVQESCERLRMCSTSVYKMVQRALSEKLKMWHCGSRQNEIFRKRRRPGESKVRSPQ
jgi:DNA-binding NtrC family response regulator